MRSPRWSWLTWVGAFLFMMGFASQAHAICGPLTQYTVTNNNDSGAGSLRDAITQANTAGCPAAINFDASVTSPIVLATELPSITVDMAITGLGQGVTVIDGAGNFQGLKTGDDINPFTISLSNLTIQNGLQSDGRCGAGLENTFNTTLTLTNVDVKNNQNTFSSGGICNNGTLTMNQGTVSGNKAFSANGGGIANFGNMTLNGVTVSGNSTEVEGESNCGGSGGGIYNDGNTLTINNSTILNNTATQGQAFCFSGNGGGIFADFGTITLDQTTVRNNQALAQNSVPELGGGGIYNGGANLTIQNGSVIDNNQAVNASGGGIYYTADLRKTLQLAAVCDGPCPAPIITTNLVIQNSAITRNTALEDGGGIYRDQIMTLTNVTVSTNTATNGEGGGIYNSGGSACFSPPCTGTLINVTVANNTAPVAGGISAPDVNIPVNLKNTLLAQNTGGNCNPIDPVAAFATLKHNLSDDDTCANFLTDSATDLNGQNANLGALGNNGGVTETHALQIPSPAIDAIAVSDCTQADGSTPLTVDQRQTSTVAAGTFSRPQDILGNGALCDIGAFEVQPAPAITVAPGSLSFQSTVGVTTAAQTVTITSTGVGPATLTSIGLTGGNAGLFAIASNTCGALPAVLKPGASCQLGITFTPNAGGTFSDANVVVGSNTPSNPNTVTLTGSAPLVPPPAPGFIYEGSGCSNMMGIPPSGSAAASLLLFAPAALNSFLKRRKK